MGDMSTLALLKPGWQEHFKVAYDYSRKLQFDFSPTKCVVIVFGRNTAPHMNTLGSHKIKESVVEEHLGVCLATEPKEEMEYVKSRIKSSQTVISMQCKTYVAIRYQLHHLLQTTCTSQ